METWLISLPQSDCLCWVGIFAALIPPEEVVVSMTLTHTGGLPYTQEGFPKSEHQTPIQRLQGRRLKMGSSPEDPDTPGAGAMFFLQGQEVSWEGG